MCSTFDFWILSILILKCNCLRSKKFKKTLYSVTISVFKGGLNDIAVPINKMSGGAAPCPLWFIRHWYNFKQRLWVRVTDIVLCSTSRQTCLAIFTNPLSRQQIRSTSNLRGQSPWKTTTFIGTTNFPTTSMLMQECKSRIVTKIGWSTFKSASIKCAWPCALSSVIEFNYYIHGSDVSRALPQLENSSNVWCL